MKKFLLGILMSFMLVSNSFAVNVPSGYSIVTSKTGITTYKNSQGFYVIDAPLWKFGIDLDSVGRMTGTNQWGHKLYKMTSVRNHWLKSDKLYYTLNGSFFAKTGSSAAFPFPLKGFSDIYQSKDTESYLPKKTLFMLKGVFPLFLDGYSESILRHSSVYDAISGLNPDSQTNQIKIKSTEKIGRHYIGCITLKEYNSRISSCKNLLFFYAVSATNAEVLAEAKKWGVKLRNIMAMDGSGSAQLYSGHLKLYGYNSDGKPDYRSFPNSLNIYTR